MKFFAFFLAAAAFICVLGAPMHCSPAKWFTTRQQSMHNEVIHRMHGLTMPANAINYSRANIATTKSADTSPAIVEPHTAASCLKKFGQTIAARFPKKYTTATAAKSNDKIDCWTVEGNMPEECMDENKGKGKGKVYTTQKEQKKGEDLEQAKEDTKMWEGHLHWDGKSKM